MKCEKCGAELNKAANFCRVCGNQINLDTLKKSHSSNLNNSETGALKKELVAISPTEKTSSSNEIKKILDEMTIEEKKLDEPTVTIPTELVNKYCKNKDIVFKSTVEDSAIENIEEKEEQQTDNEKLLELKNTEESINDKDEDKIISDDVKIDNEKLEKEISKKIESNEQVSNEVNIEENYNEKLENHDEINELNNTKKFIENHDDMELKKSNSIKQNVDLNKELIFGDVSSNDKKHYGRNFLVFFIIVVCLCVIGYLLYVLYSSRNELEKIGKEKNILQDEINNIKNNTSSSNHSASGVIFNGYKFSSIISDYSIVDDYLVLKRNDKTYRIQINKSINFESIKTKKDVYRQQLINEGYSILSYGNKHVEENDYYVFIVSDKSMKKYLIAYSKLDNESVIAFIISSNDNNIDYDLLSQTNLIISSISKNIIESSNDLKVFVEKK